jgi:hypothetical protein
MSEEGFLHEDQILAAYDAAERVLWHAIDSKEIMLLLGRERHRETVRTLAIRISEAVIHSSATDIADIPGVQVQYGFDGVNDGVHDQVVEMRAEYKPPRFR